MGMDRNTIIGFVLIGVLLIGMFVINSRNRLQYEGEQKRIADSIAALAPKPDTAAMRQDSLAALAMKQRQQSETGFAGADSVMDETIENEVVKITFSNKGGQPKQVILKKYKRFDSSFVQLGNSAFDNFSYAINTGSNKTSQSSDIIFKANTPVKSADGTQTISFTTGDSTGKQITHQFILKPNDYMVDFNISATGASQLFTNNVINLNWQTEAEQLERDHKYELTQTHIGYYRDDAFDFEYAGKGTSKSFTKPVSWIAVKQQFFIAALIAKNKLDNVVADWKVPSDTTSGYLLRTTTTAKANLSGANAAVLPLQLYYGPSDYNVLKQYNNQMEALVPFGSGIFSFVKYINRFILLPVFDFITRNVASMGIAILLLTLFIRLLTSPILYKSYLSGAKMKVLKPEVDALKEKFKNPKTGELDQQAFSVEQMKLWRTAGVSPLGGCLPAVLQIPIFMSLYYFFQSNIALRGKSFLWAADLSTYDSIAKLPFSIPFYGDHVSLFTLTAVITSLIISLYSMSNMQDNSNPVMKYMPYIFPVLLLGVFNNLPSALTWYYTISNSITLILQIVIQKYIIDHDKILTQINENKKKPKKKSKLAEKMEQMQEAQKKMQQERQGGKNGR